MYNEGCPLSDNGEHTSLVRTWMGFNSPSGLAGPCGITVIMLACHANDAGSTPVTGSVGHPVDLRSRLRPPPHRVSHEVGGQVSRLFPVPPQSLTKRRVWIMTRKWMLQPVRHCQAGELRMYVGVAQWLVLLLPKQTTRVRFPSPARRFNTTPPLGMNPECARGEPSGRLTSGD
jgi:hypothetical protein